ncbi:switch subunit 3 [Tasmannia lanceolata]|uniref:switch subunit 3 n=1 Tax=Tasmannia lanceolata TaxID=3420 RepID=UPI0040639906
MATLAPLEEAPAPSPENPPEPPPPAPAPAPIPDEPDVKSETPITDPKEQTPIIPLRPPEPLSSVPNTITIPSHARWFSWNQIHETEHRILPEFFDGKAPAKNPRVYKYYRDSIIKKFRENPSRKITLTEIRRNLVGDVGSIRRVFDFLENWGLINYSATKQNLKWEEKENKTSGLSSPNPNFIGSSFDSPLAKKASSRKVCDGCKSVMTILCFASEKVDLVLCPRCYVRGNYQIGLSSADFKRVEINEETKTEWTEKETLHLLEALLHYGDDWKKVAERVGSRNEKECVARFIKLPFGEQFMGPPAIDEIDKYYETKDTTMASPTKKRLLTPLADASNPIMAQAAFLSAMVGSDVAEAAAQAAVAALSEGNLRTVHGRKVKKIKSTAEETEAVAANGDSVTRSLEGEAMEAQASLEKEDQELEQSISNIIDVQMKEIQEKIVHFEGLELQMEKEWLQLHYMENLLFSDQLTFLQQRAPLRFAESGEREKIKDADVVT